MLFEIENKSTINNKIMKKKDKSINKLYIFYKLGINMVGMFSQTKQRMDLSDVLTQCMRLTW